MGSEGKPSLPIKFTGRGSCSRMSPNARGDVRWRLTRQTFHYGFAISDMALRNEAGVQVRRETVRGTK